MPKPSDKSGRGSGEMGKVSNPPLLNGLNGDVWSAVTLRDLFAAAAIDTERYTSHETRAEEIARSAYDVADALLAEREREREE